MIYLDTHVAAWLFFGKTSELSGVAARTIEENDLLISPIVVLELQYLFEIRKLAIGAVKIISALERDIGLHLCELPFAHVVQAALKESWTRDPFDRIIVGHARTTGAGLVTRDQSIKKHYASSVW